MSLSKYDNPSLQGRLKLVLLSVFFTSKKNDKE